MDIVLVVAVSENGVIGKEGGVPWHYPEDVEQYKTTVRGHPVAVGRRTFESMKPIEGSYHVVLTRDADREDEREDVTYVSGIPAAVDAARERGSDVLYVIGGEGVYRAFLPYATHVRLTEIPETVDGDRFFPDLGEAWVEVEREDYGGFEVVTYENTAPEAVREP